MTYYDFHELSAHRGLRMVNMNVQSLMDKINRIRRLQMGPRLCMCN